MKYFCPIHLDRPLSQEALALTCAEGHEIPMEQCGRFSIPRFDVAEEREVSVNERLYVGDSLNVKYSNFLDWLFRTFRTSEVEFRKSIFERMSLAHGAEVLVTGCGNGDDLLVLSDLFGDLDLRLHGQDISNTMVTHSAGRLEDSRQVVELNVSNASHLPYGEEQFDVVFHFGGINYFSERAAAISEMTRVVRPAGKVVIIDEGLAPWLRDTEYGRMMLNNNSLWSAQPPLRELPLNAVDVCLSWVLANCFYLLEFSKDPEFPNVDLDVVHVGQRGGSIRTRYHGQLEGVAPHLRDMARRQAVSRGMSDSEYLAALIESDVARDSA